MGNKADIRTGNKKRRRQDALYGLINYTDDNAFLKHLSGRVFTDIRIVQPYVTNWDWSKSYFCLEIFFTSHSIILYCIVPQQHSLVFGRKKVVWTWKHGPELPIYKKDYHPEKTADEGGSAEKSQECHRYPHIVLL